MRLLLIVLSCLAYSALAQNVPPPPSLEPVPDGPPDAPAGGDEFQPEVTIIRREEGVIEEYRLNGQLYMVRIIPRLGVPYYLIDSDGNGSLETRSSDLHPDLLIPSWVIFSW